jgi:iron-sulfur cluster assembly accessory protein
MLNLTEKALNKAKELIANEDEPNLALRVFVIASGCCGIDFGFEITNEFDSSDNFIDINGLKVVVDDFSYPFVENAEIDFVESEGMGYFIINSNINKGCGCGNGQCGCTKEEEYGCEDEEKCGCGNEKECNCGGSCACNN